MKSRLNITIDVSSKGYGVPGKLPDQINKLFLDAGWNVDRLEIDNTSADTLVPVNSGSLKAGEADAVKRHGKKYPDFKIIPVSHMKIGFATPISPIPTICGAEVMCHPDHVGEVRALRYHSQPNKK